jgi:PPOX class probable F420-dependent enzyme
VSAAVPGWALDLLRQARVARLGTADAGARPLVVPVCYAFDGTACWSAVDAKPKRTRALRRLRNIAENPRAALLVDEYDEQWTRLRWVMVEGRAEVLTAGDAFTRAADLLLAKYPQYRALGLDRSEGAIVRLAADRIVAWRFAA